MSRTVKGKKAPGFEYGSKLNCDKTYAIPGKVSKALANSERRSAGKAQIKKELSSD